MFAVLIFVFERYKSKEQNIVYGLKYMVVVFLIPLLLLTLPKGKPIGFYIKHLLSCSTQEDVLTIGSLILNENVIGQTTEEF